MAAASGASPRSRSRTTSSTDRPGASATARTATKKTTAKKTTTTKKATVAKKATAATTTAAKATPARTPAAATPRGRSALVAGASRASGERARRRSTPLLPAAAPVGPAAAAADPAAVTEQEVELATVPAVDGTEPTTPAAPTTPTATSRKHRPQPAPDLPTSPSPGVLARSGSRVDSRGRTGDGPARTGSARVASRAAARARRPLRAVPDLVPDARTAARAARREAAAASGSAPDLGRATRPHAVPEDGSSAAATGERRPTSAAAIRPGLEDLLQAGVAALRTAVAATGVTPEEVERQVAQTLAFLRRRLAGDFTVDEFGFDGDFTDHVYLPLLRPLYQRWFRVEVRGVENLPLEGGGLVVANHSGTLPMDALMTQVAVHDEHPTHRHLRMLGADLVFSTPVVGQLARKSGSTLATNPDAERLLREGELVGVWPEGFKGIGKPFGERYKLQRFGRGGFVSAAVSAGVPIIPCSIVGAEEIYPLLGNMKTLARLLGSPYAPVTPTWPLLGPLGLLPLPSKWIIEFGAPVATADLGPGAAEDPMLVFDLTDQIRETIQQTLYSLLMQRRSVFF